jgi:hypothetical protein
MFPVHGGEYCRLGGRRFAHDVDVETEVREWLKQESRNLYAYATGLHALVKQWDTYVNVGGGYVEK